MNEIYKKAKKNLKNYCKVCPICDGYACRGKVPGMGGIGTGNGFVSNIKALNKYQLNLRTIHNVKNPDTKYQLFNLRLKTPVLAAPMAGVTYNLGGVLSESDFINMIISGSKAAGSLGFYGDSYDTVSYPHAYSPP